MNHPPNPSDELDSIPDSAFNNLPAMPDSAPEDLAQTPPQPQISVALSPDKMKAFLSISQEPPAPYVVTTDDIYAALEKTKVTFGIQQDKIEQIVSARMYPKQTIIAKGIPMRPGVNGHLDYLIKTNPNKRPKDMGYRVDHHDLNLVENVTAGQVLARKTPAQPGEDGTDVRGKTVRAPKVKEPRLPAGKGTTTSNKNPLELIAALDGFVRLDKKTFDKIIIEQIYNIYGNVDLSTGNLDIEGSVKVNRNVLEGFRVKATGNITILGAAEACYLEAGGSIEIRGGVIGGTRRAVIKADADVRTKFADHADIVSNGNIFIDDETLLCNLQAEEMIIIGSERAGNRGRLVGGETAAGHEIRAVTVGTDKGLRTRLRVGERPALAQRRRAMLVEIHTQRNQLQQQTQQVQSWTAKYAERTPLQQIRAEERARLTEQQRALYQRSRHLFQQLQAAGISVMPEDVTATLQAEIDVTRGKLTQVCATLKTLTEKQANFEQLTPEEQQMLPQLETAQQKLANKLAEMLETLDEQKKRWAKVPKKLLREMAVSRGSLDHLQNELKKLDREDTLDKKIQTVIIQLTTESHRTAQLLSEQEHELEQLNKLIAETQNQKPRIVISDTMYQGVEVHIYSNKRAFKRPRQAICLELHEDDEGREEVIVKNLADAIG